MGNAGGFLSSGLINVSDYWSKVIGKNPKGHSLTRANNAGLLLEFITKDTSAKYIDIKIDENKNRVYVKVASEDFKNYAEEYIDLNSGMADGKKL